MHLSARQSSLGVLVHRPNVGVSLEILRVEPTFEMIKPPISASS